jgi:hypothetical protein
VRENSSNEVGSNDKKGSGDKRISPKPGEKFQSPNFKYLPTPSRNSHYSFDDGTWSLVFIIMI